VVGTLLGRGSLFFIEAFLGARYGAAAKHIPCGPEMGFVALVLCLVLVFFLVRRLPALRRAEYSQTD